MRRLYPRRVTRLPEVDLDESPPRLILVSHDHPDHYDPDSIASLPLEGVTVVLPPGIPDGDRARLAALGALLERCRAYEDRPRQRFRDQLEAPSYPAGRGR